MPVNTPQTYRIELPQFEGPFDLLLFFIKRDELDINNIAISQITDDFLTYVREMEVLNLEMASEFILVAASLMRIKAKMLLPRKPVNEEGEEEDPRAMLVQKLVEYKRYKDVIEELREKEEERARKFQRGNAEKELKQISQKALIDVELESLTLYKLMTAFERVIEKMQDRATVTHTVVNYKYTIKEQQRHIFAVIKHHGKTSFSKIFENLENRIQAIVTFLALLELLNQQQLHMIEREGMNNFCVTFPEKEELES